MSINSRFAACVVVAALAGSSVAAFADDHPYAEGPVINIARIRTLDGRFEDYAKFLDTIWKQVQEASKKAGYIVSYQVMQVTPIGPDDPDVLLMITYKNWAALDGALAKGDAIAKEVEGSLAAANQSTIERGKIRRVLGSTTMQVLELK